MVEGPKFSLKMEAKETLILHLLGVCLLSEKHVLLMKLILSISL